MRTIQIEAGHANFCRARYMPGAGRQQMAAEMRSECLAAIISRYEMESALRVDDRHVSSAPSGFLVYAGNGRHNPVMAGGLIY